jgi:hypothetical protein
MTFADVIAGEAIFLDANAFVYHFVSDPIFGAASSQAVQRIEVHGSVSAYFSPHSAQQETGNDRNL